MVNSSTNLTTVFAEGMVTSTPHPNAMLNGWYDPAFLLYRPTMHSFNTALGDGGGDIRSGTVVKFVAGLITFDNHRF